MLSQLNNLLILLGSFFIGFFASGTYIIAFKNNFTLEDKETRIIFMKRFREPKNVLLHLFAGGFIASCLQLVDLEHFVPFQALITGITWPAFVSSWLSGKQAGKEEIKNPQLESNKNMEEYRKIFNDLSRNNNGGKNE